MTDTGNGNHGFLDFRTRVDPYPLLRQLRENDPVHWVEDLQGWLVTRYADCEAASHEPSLSLGGGLAAIFRNLPPSTAQEIGPLQRHISMGMGSLDPPEHTRIRAPMNKAFASRLIRNQAAVTQKMADELLDRVIRTGSMEVVADIAYPLPAIVIANLLGTNRADPNLFMRCSDAIGDLFGSAAPSVEVMKSAQDHVLALTDHLHGLFRLHGDSLAEDSLVGMLLAEDCDSGSVSREELVANCVELLFAGHLTITSMIGTCLLTLLQHPRALAELRETPALMASAIEELLRFESPIQMVRRLATRPFELGGKQIEPGHMVWLHLGAANRDGARYRDPDAFDIHRDGIRHQAFGVGVHYCLGAALARLEGEVVLNTMLRRLPDLRMAAESVEWHDLPTVRTLKALPVLFTPSERCA